MMRPIYFTLYTGPDKGELYTEEHYWPRPVSLRAILADKNLAILARAEDSGSEACYVELAAWDWEAGQWCRYGFEKFFGGELWRGLDCYETCERLAAIINKRKHTDPLQRFIPTLPSFPHRRPAKGAVPENTSA